MRGLVGAAAGLWGVNGAEIPWVSAVKSSGPPSEICARSRHRVLNKTLDRNAMERGWARTLSAEHYHCPQSAMEAFKDLKFGIRIHWGLCCLIGSHESWG